MMRRVSDAVLAVLILGVMSVGALADYGDHKAGAQGGRGGNTSIGTRPDGVADALRMWELNAASDSVSVVYRDADGALMPLMRVVFLFAGGGTPDSLRMSLYWAGGDSAMFYPIYLNPAMPYMEVETAGAESVRVGGYDGATNELRVLGVFGW